MPVETRALAGPAAPQAAPGSSASFSASSASAAFSATASKRDALLPQRKRLDFLQLQVAGQWLGPRRLGQHARQNLVGHSADVGADGR